MNHELVLHGDLGWESPWVFHALVALEEKRLPYALELWPLPLPAEVRARLRAKNGVGRVPVLEHGDVAIGESLAISEYLAETFPAPDHPRLFPADLGERARARQIMSYLRTGLFALRAQRPTSSVFGAQTTQPLTDEARAQADELVAAATHAVGDRTTIGGAWSIADADLGLALMRLVANGDSVPAHLHAYVRAQWTRPSVQAYLRHAASARAAPPIDDGSKASADATVVGESREPAR